MTQNSKQGQYPIRPDDADEGKRLGQQDELLNNLLPLFAKGVTCPKRVLDVACGTGGWLRRVAHAYPDSECIGVDKSALLLDYARDLAAGERVQVKYVQGDMFDINKASKYSPFDYIHMRCATWFLGARVSEVFGYCHQMLAPGGTFCVIDFRQPFRSNSDAMHRFNDYFMVALQKRGTSYTNIDEIAQIFSTLDLIDIQQEFFSLDLSAGVKGREGFVSDLRKVFAVFESILLEVLGKQDYDNLKLQALHDLDADGFEMFSDALMIFGQKTYGNSPK